ncbi:SDR family NAD(P)-dependent oxidoreductase [Streptomyces sp. NPDC054770]
METPVGQPDHRTALIAGATSGIGLAAARALAAEGAYVFLTGRREECWRRLGRRWAPTERRASPPTSPSSPTCSRSKRRYRCSRRVPR